MSNFLHFQQQSKVFHSGVNTRTSWSKIKTRKYLKYPKWANWTNNIPKQGFRNTNDSNTQRRFFTDTATSFITLLKEQLIKKCKIILEAISSGVKIDSEKFETYALKTARQFFFIMAGI